MDAVQELLLAQIAGDGGQGATPSWPDVLEQALGDNPMAAPLAEALRRRQEVVDQQDDPWEVDVEATDTDVVDVLQRLYAEVESLRTRTAVLADALGACRVCWGDDIDCPACHGRGRPGGRSPRADAFDDLVDPAVRRRHRDLSVAALAAAQPPETP